MATFPILSPCLSNFTCTLSCMYKYSLYKFFLNITLPSRNSPFTTWYHKYLALFLMGSLEQQTILVTGGAGFIGSHTALQLLQQGFKVHAIDNLDNSVKEALDRVRELVGQELSNNLYFHLVIFRFLCFINFQDSMTLGY